MKDVRIEHALRILGRAANTAAEEALEPLGITPIEYDFLEAINRYMENPETFNWKVPHVSGSVATTKNSGFDYMPRLERSGYVRRECGGRRLLTNKGLEFLQDCRTALRHTERYWQGVFGVNGEEVLNEAFEDWYNEVNNQWRT